MMYSSRTTLSLATAILAFAFHSSSNNNVAVVFASKQGKKKKKTDTVVTEEFYRIVSSKDDLTFILAEGTSMSVDNKSSWTSPSLIGSQFLINGNVYLQDEIIVDVHGKIVEESKTSEHTTGFIYNQQCTAVKGIFDLEPDAVRVLENICNYNFCMPERGCLFLRSGGSFDFNPFDRSPEAVPPIEATIIGGTQSFLGVFGSASITQIARPTDNDGNSVLQFDLILVDLWTSLL